tara:strand:+ start:272 stop:619 length:348 start_codon:yes stop_codon:yes gene_type:complete
MTEKDDFQEQIHSFNADKEIDVILSFLDEVSKDAERLKILFKEMKIYRRHGLEMQVQKFHEILKYFQCFETDVEINAERTKKISSKLREEGLKSEHITDKWKETLKTEERWNFDW